MNGEMWERTDDIVGYRPRFDIWCRFCDTDMVLRFSAMVPEPHNLHGFSEAGAQLAYKCPTCGYHIRFNIPDSKEYIQKIFDLRGEKEHHHDFNKLSENEAVARQLEGLGYFGGRDNEQQED